MCVLWSGGMTGSPPCKKPESSDLINAGAGTHQCLSTNDLFHLVSNDLHVFSIFRFNLTIPRKIDGGGQSASVGLLKICLGTTSDFPLASPGKPLSCMQTCRRRWPRWTRWKTWKLQSLWSHPSPKSRERSGAWGMGCAGWHCSGTYQCSRG